LRNFENTGLRNVSYRHDHAGHRHCAIFNLTVSEKFWKLLRKQGELKNRQGHLFLKKLPQLCGNCEDKICGVFY